MIIGAIDPLVIPIVGILMPLLLVPTIIVLKYRQARREWEHLERMKAMNNGRPVATSSTYCGVAAIGAGVPIASVLAALAASLLLDSHSSDEIEMYGIVWGCAALISALALASSLILAAIQSRARDATRTTQTLMNDKPAFDPDALDVVSSRG